MQSRELHSNERLDDLMTSSGLKIIQSKEVFSFSLDAVLLARFANVPTKGKIADLCTGNGVIPILLSDRTTASIDAIEIQPRLVDMARRSVAWNNLSEQITVIEHDLRTYPSTIGNTVYDAVTVNPPYMTVQSGEIKGNEHYAIARHEVLCTIDDVANTCNKILRPGGKLFMVHRPSRLLDIMEALRRWRLEPKKIQFVHPNEQTPANIVLIEALRDGKPELKVMPPIVVYDQKGVQQI
ncbi:tRNA1(Val) (adenine(37)-N6)-methyltransferase [Paenibacillus yanchengensis]|uniref:tRNA1(Val) (Adenine(37)-N6)-methyltransferase n=1 Tax=Paenibacillus yanchengensis TaxID=2035833 RepID=A0ABW4YIB9_9BACL